MKNKSTIHSLNMFVFVLISFPTDLLAFQPCSAGTSPCASPWQVLLLVVFPSLSLLGFAMLAKQKIQREWLRRSTITLIGGVWIIWLFIVLFTFSAFLADCSGSCWYSLLN